MSGHILVLANSHSLVFLLNSRLGHFSAATSLWLPFSRSYRVILPSSLAAGHSSALVYSTGPPVSVCGTGRTGVKLRSFSWKYGYVLPLGRSLAILSGSASPADLPAGNLPTPFSAPNVRGRRSTVTLSSLLRLPRKFRNVDRMSFGAPFRVVLRPRLTLIRLTLIRNPWSCGVNVSHTHYRYLCLHLLFHPLQKASRLTFSADGMLPYPS